MISKRSINYILRPEDFTINAGSGDPRMINEANPEVRAVTLLSAG